MLELNKIYNEDCLEGMKNIENQSVDMILTDPPYNISVKNNFHTMGRFGIDFGDWDKTFNLTEWLSIALDKLKQGGNIIIFNSWKNLGDIGHYLKENDCLLKEQIVWKKTNPMPRNRDRLYVTSCEFAIWATKNKGWTFNRQRKNYENAVFEYPIVSHNKRYHPTQKPVELMMDLIKIHTNQNDIVLDPFAGSGTTCVAAKKLNRRFLGFEIDCKYNDLANQRLNEQKIDT